MVSLDLLTLSHDAWQWRYQQLWRESCPTIDGQPRAHLHLEELCHPHWMQTWCNVFLLSVFVAWTLFRGLLFLRLTFMRLCVGFCAVFFSFSPFWVIDQDRFGLPFVSNFRCALVFSPCLTVSLFLHFHLASLHVPSSLPLSCTMALLCFSLLTIM